MANKDMPNKPTIIIIDGGMAIVLDKIASISAIRQYDAQNNYVFGIEYADDNSIPVIGSLGEVTWKKRRLLDLFNVVEIGKNS